MQAERLKEKAQAKKSSINAVSKLRKQRQKSGFQGELDMDAELAAMNKHQNNGPHRLSKCEFPSSQDMSKQSSYSGLQKARTVRTSCKISA